MIAPCLPSGPFSQRHASAKDSSRRLSPSAQSALDIGKAAEHLVCADLMLEGYRVFLSDQGLPYDVLVDLGSNFVRVQVKATMRPKNANAQGRTPNMVYSFHVRRRGKFGKGERLDSQHCDVVALVALDARLIAYMPIANVAQTIALYPAGYKFPGKYKRSRYAAIDGFPFGKAIGPLDDLP